MSSTEDEQARSGVHLPAEATKVWQQRYPQAEVWLEERIWGHRIYDESTPELMLLEMLNVAASARRGKLSPFVDEPNKVAFRRSLLLRTILFNNDALHDELGVAADADLWDAQLKSLTAAWKDYSIEKAGENPTSAYGISDATDLQFLRERFDDYDGYKRLVDLLRANAIEYESNKRWTSMFLFPYCERALFADLDNKPSRIFSNDRRFFGRTGEIAYLMLCRSGLGKEIWDGLKPLLFDDDAPHVKRWSRAIAALTHGEAEEVEGQSGGDAIGYLPPTADAHCRTFGEDAAALLAAGMPEYDALPHLAALCAFHLSHYVLAVSADGLGGRGAEQSSRPLYVIEVRSRRADQVRRLSQARYQINRQLSEKRLKCAIAEVKQHPDARRLTEVGDGKALKKWLTENVWRMKKGVPDAPHPSKLWEEFEEAALRKHRGHLGNVPHEFARTCGLGSSAGTNGYRYMPSDNFLRTLVLVNVSRRMEFTRFVDRLYDRYGFVIAERHAAREKLGRDLTAFGENEDRLRARLTNLGLLRPLSDDCAYVLNRYQEAQVAKDKEEAA